MSEYIEFDQIFTDPNAPQNTKQLVQIASIEHVYINTAGDDTENTGPYFVWLGLHSGIVFAIFIGTLEECIAEFKKLQSTLKVLVSY